MLRNPKQGGVKKQITPQAGEMLKESAEVMTGVSPLYNLFYIVAYMLDAACEEDNTCIIIGATRDKSSYNLTCKVDGENTTVYGANVPALMEAIETLLV